MANQNLLSDHDYAILAAEAAKIGKQPEQLLQEVVQNLQSPTFEKLAAKFEEFYTLLIASTVQSRKRPEQLLDEVANRLRRPAARNQTTATLQGFMESQYNKGKISHIPTGTSPTPEELEEIDACAQWFGDGKPLSEMIIEDREPSSSDREFDTQAKPPMTLEELDQLLFLEGKITHIPKGGVLTPEQREEREKRAQWFSGGKSGSEMVIEDREPN